MTTEKHGPLAQSGQTRINPDFFSVVDNFLKGQSFYCHKLKISTKYSKPIFSLPNNEIFQKMIWNDNVFSTILWMPSEGKFSVEKTIRKIINPWPFFIKKKILYSYDSVHYDDGEITHCCYVNLGYQLVELVFCFSKNSFEGLSAKLDLMN